MNGIFIKNSFIFIVIAVFAAISSLQFKASAESTPAPILTADVDGNWRRLPPTDHVTLLMYTNGDLEKQSRSMSQALDPLRGKKNFSFIQVVDLRGDVPAIARRMVEKDIRKQLDREATRVEPFYLQNDNKSNPRQDMVTIVDFSGGILKKLDWHGHYSNIRLIIFDKHGQEVKRYDKVESPEAIAEDLKAMM